MKKISAICLMAFVLAALLKVPAFCQNMYVGDITQLNLRAGQGVDHKVITTLASGEQVTVLSTAGDWTKISTADGSEGWVASRYLTAEKPPDVKIEDMQIQMETLKGELEMATLENRKLTEENISLTTRLNEKSLKLGKIEKAFADLEANCEDYLRLKEDYEKTSNELSENRERMQLLEKKVDNQYVNIAIKWTLTGAGILLIGYFLGSRARRKRSSLL
jgi:SH3 domain protein